jgi:hypothetical protein
MDNRLEVDTDVPDIDEMFRNAEVEQAIAEAGELGQMFATFHDALRESKMTEETASRLTSMYAVHTFNMALVPAPPEA